MGTALNQVQDLFLKKFFATRFGRDFYLTGGTALARFYFHHRESVDLDLFTNNRQIDFTKLNLAIHRIAQELKFKLINEVNTEDFLQYNFSTGKGLNLKIDVVKDIPVHFGKFLIKKGIRVDSLENIGSNKILAIFGRTDPKDFIDLYYLLEIAKLDFDKLYKMAAKKDLGLNNFYLASALEGINKQMVWPKLLKPLGKKELFGFFQKLHLEVLVKIDPRE